MRSCPHGLDIRPTRPQCRWSSLWGSHFDQLRGQTQLVNRAGGIQLSLLSVSKFARTAYSSSFHEALQYMKTVIQLSGCPVVVEGVGSALCSYRNRTRNVWVTVITVVVRMDLGLSLKSARILLMFLSEEGLYTETLEITLLSSFSSPFRVLRQDPPPPL